MTEILKDAVSDVAKSVYDSDESVVLETDDDSIKDRFSLHSDNEAVPKLRRTKSVLMDEMPRSDALYDSSDDDDAHPSTSKSEIASQRPKRSCWHPKSLVESDNTSEGSEEEYVPNFREESTDSDSSMELSMENKKKDKVDSTSQMRTKSSSQPQCESRQYGRFETEPDSTQRFPIVTADANEDEMVEEPRVR
ncbi:lisH domain-containing protein C1711.05-like [Parambassis ranga]|uniref:LisH domain-containing protein C1711.05-like n=1 Tax=Parambassis ranga TaxID=210632 RepID=A0A6P7J1P4_9TELE|nr:lisH domain-containing protein C1711.05-like [Parambassis ranga]